MITELAKVWSQVEQLLVEGISIIPVRDKDEKTASGETYLAKTPYAKWKQYQDRQINRDELWQMMDEKSTTAVAMICGKISGNIEVIDVDVKYKPGIDATILADLRSFYPQLYSRLRIHRTPSTGLHIPYKVLGQSVPGNLKLAGRLASQDEIELQIARGVKRPNKEVNFLETRGEGGYVLLPPSMGYTINQDNPIPEITWEERCAIVTLCESYNEIIKEAPKPKPTKTQEEYYNENPFEHFNRTTDPVTLLERFGWKYSHKNTKFIWFTRPDKDKGVSASWNLERQIYYIFTTSTELQGNKGYHPASILAELEFSGDKSRTYHALVNQGYGVVKPKVETNTIKRAVTSGKPLPANFSDQARAEYERQQEQLKEDHPFGVFIKYDADEEKQQVSRESLYYVAKEIGFRSHDGGIVKLDGYKISWVTEREFQDAMKAYIHEEDAEEYETLCNIYEAFMQRNGKFSMQRLALLDTTEIYADERSASYKFYQNGLLTITAEEISFSSYDSFTGLVWADKIQPRDYIEGEGGRFVDFLKLAVTDIDQASKVLGYLAHEYKDETTGYIIVLTEQCPDPKQGGGSGKNVFCNLLKLTTTYTSKPGSQAKFDEKFFQSWNRQRVFGISDVPKNFDFAFLKEPATGSFIWKKLFKDEIEVNVNEAPKFIVQTNFSYEISDGGLARRIIPIEFTNFFTLAGGLDVYFGVHFPNGWTEEDYAGFDNFVANSIQLWIQGGNKLKATELTETGWIKQWEQTYGNATGFILEYWDEWQLTGCVTNESFKLSMEKYYNDNNVQKHYWPSSTKLNAAITSYCEKKSVPFAKDKNKKFSNGQFKCRVFGNPDQVPIGGEDITTEQTDEKDNPF